MPEYETVTLELNVDGWRVSTRRFAAACNFLGALVGHGATETAEERSARITDARDTYYMARDAAEGI